MNLLNFHLPQNSYDNVITSWLESLLVCFVINQCISCWYFMFNSLWHAVLNNDLLWCYYITAIYVLANLFSVSSVVLIRWSSPEFLMSIILMSPIPFISQGLEIILSLESGCTLIELSYYLKHVLISCLI